MLMQKIKREAATLRDILYHRLYFTRQTKKDIIDQFHKLYYDSSVHDKTWINTQWLGIPVAKTPLDSWIYQELIYTLKPDLIIETGTYLGGSAFFMATVCDLLGKGKLITVDTQDLETVKSRIKTVPPIMRPPHPRITYLLGSSIAPDIIEPIKRAAHDAQQVMVFLDSDHTQHHVAEELRVYSPLVSKGSYLVVEDTNINGHPVYPGFGPGPMEALKEFLVDNKDFIVDESMEKHLMTFNPKGYLRRVR